MRTFITAAILASASFAAFAQATPAAADPAVQVQGKPTRYFMHQDDYQDIKGKYLLSNGKVLTMTNKQRRFFAEVEGQPVVEITPVGSRSFVARGADMQLKFDEIRDGRATDVVVNMRGISVASVSPEVFRTLVGAP